MSNDQNNAAAALAKLTKIKERIAKLLAMSKDVSSPEEAAIAAGRARKMMDEYQIEEYELNVVKEEFLQRRGTLVLKNFPKYMEFLATKVCTLNDCQAVYEYDTHSADPTKQGKFINFRGYSQDVEFAVEMYKSLLDTVNRLAKEFLTNGGHRQDDHRLAGFFKEGAVTAINNTIHGMIQERRQLMKTSTGTSIVVRKEGEVARHFGAVKYGSSKARQMTGREQSAKEAGYREGTKVEVRSKIV